MKEKMLTFILRLMTGKGIRLPLCAQERTLDNTDVARLTDAEDNLDKAQPLANNHECYESFIYTVNGDEIKIIKCDPSVIHVRIPPKIDGRVVTEIGDGAFYKCGLSNIDMPETMKTIGEFAFYGCISLESIKIPNSVINIGNRAFYQCSNLTGYLNIPENVEIIDQYAFAHTGLTSVTFCHNDSVDWNGSIGQGAFFGCKSLSTITLTGSYPSIGNSAFSGCNQLKNLTIPNGVKNLGYCFIQGDAISKIVIPVTVTSAGGIFYGALSGCATLKEVKFADGTLAIPAYICDMYHYKSFIESVYIPYSVKEIGERAFYGCKNITDIYYQGSEATWNTITIGVDNNILSNATIHYNWDCEFKSGADSDTDSLTDRSKIPPLLPHHQNNSLNFRIRKQLRTVKNAYRQRETAAHISDIVY